MDDTVTTVFFDDMLYPFLDVRIAAFDGLTITILAPQHIAREGECCCPRHIVAIVIPEGRGYIRNTTVRTLCLADVAHPFGVQALVVEEEALAQRPYRTITQPRLAFVALRTVERHALIVVQDAPPGVLHHLV